MIPTPKEAFELLKEYNKGEFHLKHGKRQVRRYYEDLFEDRKRYYR